MAKRFFRKLALLAKIEVTEGTDAVPTGAANAIQASEVQLTPLEADSVSRNLYQTYFGNQGELLAGEYVSLTFKVELAGAGAGGTAPAYGPLLRMCALAETITAATKVEYDPVTDDAESGTIYLNMDGVNHAMVGARGNVKFSLTPKGIPYLEFSMLGLFVAAADVALPAADLTGFTKPVIVSKTNTPVFSLHGIASIGESLSIDLGNKVEPRFLIGEDSMPITDRQASGAIVIEAKSVATVDWIGIALARTRGALAVQHGTAAGNIVELAAPAVEIGKPGQGETQGIINYSLPLILCPDAGDDEFKLTVR